MYIYLGAILGGSGVFLSAMVSLFKFLSDKKNQKLIKENAILKQKNIALKDEISFMSKQKMSTEQQTQISIQQLQQRLDQLEKELPKKVLRTIGKAWTDFNSENYSSSNSRLSQTHQNN